MDFNQAITTVKESTFKLTRAREAILEAIFQIDGPFSANILDGRIQSRGLARDAKLEAKNGTKRELKRDAKLEPKPVKKISADVVTIYRNLSIFEDLKIIGRCDFSDDEVMYEVLHGDHAHHHHHIVCKTCKKIEPLEFCIVEGQEQILAKLGYQDLSHRLEFSGVCPDCAKSSQKASRRANTRGA